MNKRLEKKLAKLPTSPGVYFYKNASGEIIYIGKAANLRNRVRQYFQKSRAFDPKTDALVAEINAVDWTELENEVDALFLEAELVRRYQPSYNILLRDDKSLQYVRVDYKSDYPTVSMVRRPLDDGAKYFGPYLRGPAIQKALRYLRRAFPYATHRPVAQKRASLHYHLGLDPGLEDSRTSLEDYRANLRKLMQYLSGQRVALVREIERDMKQAAKAKNFEKATIFRNQLFALRELSHQILFGDREIQAASRDQALADLANLLGLAKAPRRLEGFDISHMQGTDTVASMVVFSSGLPEKTAYRKFKMRLIGNDDAGHIREVVTRRFREENRRKWGQPDLVLIDGGKAQLSSALQAYAKTGLKPLPMIGLAKRQEEIIVRKANEVNSQQSTVSSSNVTIRRSYVKKIGGRFTESGDFVSILLPENSNIVKLLQRIRDESHRFAVSYHSILKRGRQTASLLDEIPGIGPATRKKLIRHFGSAKGVLAASEAELQELLGKTKGLSLARYLASYR